MSLPQFIVKIDVDHPPLTANDDIDWEDANDARDKPEDVSAYVKWTDARGNNTIIQAITRGRRNELGDIEPGTLTLTLNNVDRRFDPNDSTGPYFGKLKPMNKIRVGAIWSGDYYWLFTGYVEAWPTAYLGGTISTTTITAVDGHKYLNLAELTDFSRAQEGSGDRVDAILDEVDWPAGDRVTAVGDIDVAQEEVTKVSALATLRRIADAERGLFFFSGRGSTIFQDRSYRGTLLSSGHWSNTGADLAYSDFQWRYDDSSIWNDIRVTRSGGIEQASEDATSISDFFRRTLPLTNLPLVDDADALDTADWTLAQFKDARVRPDLLTIDPAVRDSWATVLALDISDVMQIDHTTIDITDTSGSVIVAGFTTSLNAHVEGVQWRITKGVWKLILNLSPSFVITAGTGTLNTTDEWIAPTLVNSWVDYGSPEAPSGYRKEGDWVHLRGSIEGGTSGSVALTLPVGFRPSERVRLATVSGGTANGQLRIDTNGEIRVSDAATTAGVTVPSYVALDGSFRIV